MSWQDIMRRVLPPADGVQPHITGPAGRFGAGEAEGRQKPSSIPHGGVDFNYLGGETAKLNQSHPALRSPVDGTVVNAGEGNVGRIAIRDKEGYLHELFHTDKRYVVKGIPVVAGQIIGTMGKTGTRQPHVHYQLKDPNGKAIDPTEFFDRQGPIDPNPLPPPHLDSESLRAAQIASGGNTNSASSAFPPDRPGDPFFSPFGQPIPAPANQNPIADRFGPWGSVPAANAAAASDDPANFDDRFGNRASSPGGVLGNAFPPALRVPNRGQRSEIPDGVTPASATADDSAPVRILSRRTINLSPASSDAPPLAPASPLLGIFSGKPMPDYPVPPSIWGLPDNPQSSGEDEWLQRWRRAIDQA